MKSGKLYIASIGDVEPGSAPPTEVAKVIPYPLFMSATLPSSECSIFPF
jgi:hypothetical protein